jgi:hypothetical protein
LKWTSKFDINPQLTNLHQAQRPLYMVGQWARGQWM